MNITIDQRIAEEIGKLVIKDPNGDWPIGNLILCVIALLFSVVLCGIIGIEREWRGRSAGLRTHLLVGVGSCILMIISIYGFPALIGNRDVARLAAQVIAGVGFLGAGAIIYRNSGTRGLTTAATIWIVMAIGLACGSFNFILAIVGTGLILIVLTLFRKMELKLNKKAPLILVRSKPGVPIVASLLETAKQFDCTLHDLRFEQTEAGLVESTFLLTSNRDNLVANDFIAAIGNVEGVEFASTLNSHHS